ncbi:recombinase family protein [Streptomyces sp. NPDC050997]|uniref:recombinase family protein n=1 Tax=Streptomyces sp. NPDC050997 TaxID=3155519 RepID=UPI003413D761
MPRATIPAVTYASTTLHGNLDALQQRLPAYAREHRLDVVASYADREGQREPAEKPHLQAAIDQVREGRAKVLLTVTVSMISPVCAEYDAVLADARAARGQLVCTGWSPPPAK